MKILTLNSIGIDRHGFHIIHSPSRWSEGVRDSCHWFTYYPWELAYLTSLLKRETEHEVRMVDGCLERLDAEGLFNRLVREKPDMLVLECASRTIDETLEVAFRLKRKYGTVLVLAGPHATAFPEELKSAGVDHICRGEYEFTVLDLVQGKPVEDIPGLYPNPDRDLLDVNLLPFPEDDDVSRFSYADPGEPSSEYREIQMYASRGCPMSCGFCVARHVYYRRPNWRPRRVENIISEIESMRRKYPEMEGIFFDEEAHNVEREFSLRLCSAIRRAGLNNLHYEAMCDIRFLDEEVLRRMKEACYYKLRIGIESASDKVLQGVNKPGLDQALVRQRLKSIKKHKLKTHGTFIFGAPGSDAKEDGKTVRLIQDLVAARLLDNLQISICTPQPGTPFFESAVRNGLLKNCDYQRFDGGNFAVVSYPGYSSEQIEAVREKAVLVRDHFILKKRIGEKSLFTWAGSVVRRYGLVKTAVKIMRRLKREVKYHWLNNR